MPSADQVPVKSPHSTMHWHMWVVLIAGSCRDNTGSVAGGFRGADEPPPRCKVCAHPDRLAIEEAKRAGASLDNLAARFNINRNSIWQHCRSHVGIAKADTIRRPASAYALEFTILTAVRKTQALECRWSEFDRPAKLWVCPSERTKEKHGDHVIPLSDAAMIVLDTMEELQKANGIQSEYVFPGGRGGKSSVPMSSSSVVKFLKESLGRRDLTIHGFRTSFKSWARQNYSHKTAAAEVCLDHAVPGLDKIYGRQADLIDDCRMLLDNWAAYCERGPLPADVIPIRQAK